jgi:serine/threonine protein kinase
MAMAKKWGRWINAGETLGEGGQGRVFVVHDASDPERRQFALKLLKNPNRLGRFQREIDALRRLPVHRNLITIFDAATAPDGPV